MKKGRFCQSWTFSPKHHSKVGPAKGVGVRTYGVQQAPAAVFWSSGQESKGEHLSVLFVSVYQ